MKELCEPIVDWACSTVKASRAPGHTEQQKRDYVERLIALPPGQIFGLSAQVMEFRKHSEPDYSAMLDFAIEILGDEWWPKDRLTDIGASHSSLH